MIKMRYTCTTSASKLNRHVFFISKDICHPINNLQSVHVHCCIQNSPSSWRPVTTSTTTKKQKKHNKAITKSPAVIWHLYYRYCVKHVPINQSSNQSKSLYLYKQIHKPKMSACFSFSNMVNPASEYPIKYGELMSPFLSLL